MLTKNRNAMLIEMEGSAGAIWHIATTLLCTVFNGLSAYMHDVMQWESDLFYLLSLSFGIFVWLDFLSIKLGNVHIVTARVCVWERSLNFFVGQLLLIM